MLLMEESTKTILQAKVFDFALSELVLSHRESFEPLWTVDSWVKFLIWNALNCGLSGERESLEMFANSLGDDFSIPMRRIFFERTFIDLGLKLYGDPAEKNILLRSSSQNLEITFENLENALFQAKLVGKVDTNQENWSKVKNGFLIPWKSS